MLSLLAFCGRRMAGKSFASSILNEFDSRFTLMSFADIPKDEYAELEGIPREDLNTPGIKERHRKGFIAYVEGRKKKDKGYWAKKLVKNIQSDHVVIDDLRFLEELEQVVKLNGLVYKVHANPEVRKARGWVHDARVDEHYSETEMDLSPYTFYTLTGGGIIYNNEINTDHKLRGQIYKLLNTHFR